MSDQPADDNAHELDFVLWTEKQARLLRAGRVKELDLEHLTEDLEAMAGKERRELRSRLTAFWCTCSDAATNRNEKRPVG